ncbi:MAG: LacI family DNA-binding transcriptional regulator [Turicibacter sp.]|nr:LacI family DNA-binding transcriptional regulator [Turicibacter sp.]
MSTIKEVAKRAGVSVGTVSKVINNIEVKPKTKEAVDLAIKELNYQPNVYARGFKMNRTHTIALILPTVWHPFFGELAYNIEKNLREYQYKMILCNSEGDYLTELSYLTMAKQNQVDGIIAITYSDIEAYISSNLPLISIDRFFTHEVPYVSSDNFLGGELAAKHLDEMGCEALCFIGAGSKKDNTTRNRKKGFINYCQTHQKQYEIFELIGGQGEFHEKMEQFLMENVIQRRVIDGIFAVTDFQALEVIRFLERHHISIPDDVQVIGFDGVKASNQDQIEISTIRQPIEEIAKESVKGMIQLINKEIVSREILLPVRLIQGKTTKCKR